MEPQPASNASGSWLGRFDHRVLRFVAVGSLNTGFSYGTYALLVWIGLPFWLANFGSLVLGILFSFKTQGALVFRQTEGRRFPRFVACWAAMFVIHTLLIGIFIHLGLNAYWAGAAALLPVTVLSYFVQRLWVFR